MKTLLSTLFLASVVSTTMALAQSGEDPKRMAAVQKCVAEAQKAVPTTSTDHTDPELARRYNVYASCMRNQGFNP